MHKSWMWKQRSYREQFEGTEGGSAVGGAGEAEGGEQQAEQTEGETLEGEQAGEQSEQQAEEDGEVVITIGDEAPPAANDDEIEGKPAPAWVKELRKTARDLAKENRELKQAQQQAAQQQAAPKVDPVGEKPTPDQFDFDSEAYGDALLAWNDRKKKADEAAAAARQEQEAAQTAWQQRITTYNTAKAALKVPDFDDAEHVVRGTMSQTQIGVMLNGADKPELLVYALGRNPAKAKELAAIKDPVKFAFACAKVETQLKVAPRKAPPPAERVIRGSAGGATGVDNTLARLEAEADRTGDRTKVAAYRREQRNKAA